MNNTFKQFDIILAGLDPTIGSEQKGIRPCLIIESNASLNAGNTFIVIPFTSSNIERKFPYNVLVKHNSLNGLSVDSKLKCNQVRVIDKKRIKFKLGSLEKLYFEEVFNAMDNILDIRGDFR